MVTQCGWQPAETKYTTPNPDTRSLETCPVAVILISDQLHNSNPSKLQELGRIAYIDNHTLTKEYVHILSQQSYMFNFNSCEKHHNLLDKFNQKNPLWQSGSRISIRQMLQYWMYEPKGNEINGINGNGNDIISRRTFHSKGITKTLLSCLINF